jgi:hypothetical protein
VALYESYLYVIMWILTDSCLLSHMSYCSTYMTSNYFQSEIEVTAAVACCLCGGTSIVVRCTVTVCLRNILCHISVKFSDFFRF